MYFYNRLYLCRSEAAVDVYDIYNYTQQIRFLPSCVFESYTPTYLHILYLYIIYIYALSDLLLRVCGVLGFVFKQQETFALNRPEVLRGRTDWRNYLRPFSSAAGAAATLYTSGVFC